MSHDTHWYKVETLKCYNISNILSKKITVVDQTNSCLYATKMQSTLVREVVKEQITHLRSHHFWLYFSGGVSPLKTLHRHWSMRYPKGRKAIFSNAIFIKKLISLSVKIKKIRHPWKFKTVNNKQSI